MADPVQVLDFKGKWDLILVLLDRQRVLSKLLVVEINVSRQELLLILRESRVLVEDLENEVFELDDLD